MVSRGDPMAPCPYHPLAGPWTTRRHHRFQDAPGAPSFILCNTVLTITLDMEATTVEGVKTRFKLSTEIDLDENHRSWAKLPVWQHYARACMS